VVLPTLAVYTSAVAVAAELLARTARMCRARSKRLVFFGQLTAKGRLSHRPSHALDLLNQAGACMGGAQSCDRIGARSIKGALHRGRGEEGRVTERRGLKLKVERTSPSIDWPQHGQQGERNNFKDRGGIGCLRSGSRV
jgi:hypothetical protein